MPRAGGYSCVRLPRCSPAARRYKTSSTSTTYSVVSSARAKRLDRRDRSGYDHRSVIRGSTVGRGARGAIVQGKTTRYNRPRGFTANALGEISPPVGATRVQLVIRAPGYGKNGYRSTGWMSLDEFDPDGLEDAFGINPDAVRSVIFDSGG